MKLNTLHNIKNHKNVFPKTNKQKQGVTCRIRRSPYENPFESPLKISINEIAIPKDMIDKNNTEEELEQVCFYTNKKSQNIVINTDKNG